MCSLLCTFTGRASRLMSHILYICYKKFLFIYPWRWDQIGCPETSIRIYHYTLRNSPVERRAHLLPGGNPKSRDPRLHIPLGTTLPTAQPARKMMASSAVPFTPAWMTDETTQFLTAYAQWSRVLLHSQVTPCYVSWGNKTTACFLTNINVHTWLRYPASAFCFSVLTICNTQLGIVITLSYLHKRITVHCQTWNF